MKLVVFAVLDSGVVQSPTSTFHSVQELTALLVVVNEVARSSLHYLCVRHLTNWCVGHKICFSSFQVEKKIHHRELLQSFVVSDFSLVASEQFSKYCALAVLE